MATGASESCRHRSILDPPREGRERREKQAAARPITIIRMIIMSRMAFGCMPRWRRPQFGLRSLLIGVTLLGLGVASFAWQVNAVKSRRELADEITARGGSVYSASELQTPQDGDPIPSFRRWLGDGAVGTIYLPSPNFSERDFRDPRSFPEAHIWPATPVANK